jgi:hypothetical protein
MSAFVLWMPGCVRILTDAAGDVTAASEPRSVSWRDHRVLCWRKNTGGGVAYARVDNREHGLDFGRSTSLWGLI